MSYPEGPEIRQLFRRTRSGNRTKRLYRILRNIVNIVGWMAFAADIVVLYKFL